MKIWNRRLAMALFFTFPACAIAASEKEELLKLKNTTINLIDALVQQGILDKKKAESIVQQAESKAVEDTKKEMEKEKAEVAKETETPMDKTGNKAESAPVRVTYVPDFVKEEIRKDVRAELRDEVVKEVKTQAKNEKWGIPAALPDWVNRFKLYGDFRTRMEDQLYGSDNIKYSYIAWPAVNAKGGLIQAGPDAFFNTTDDRIRSRIRLRLALDAQIADHFKTGVRITTSNDRNPISINQTLGQYGYQYELALDRAFLQYDFFDGKDINWFNTWVGRFANPFFSTDNLHDPDLSFEGFATALHFSINENDQQVKAYVADMPHGRQQINMGNSMPDQLFLTVGVFPLQNVFTSNTSTNKWMWATQGGFDWLFGRSTRLKTAVAYYDYNNIRGIQNPLGSREYDWSAPLFFTKGNSLMRISNDVGESSLNPRLVGLASDFRIFDAVASLDYGGFGKNHVMLTGNFTDNFGFDQQQIYQRTGENIKPRTIAYQLRLDVGRTEIEKFGDWSLWFAYKYLQRDSVLDAYTDSNFHLAGTDAKGWVAAANFGLLKNTWANVRWLSSTIIDGSDKNGGPPYSIDVLLLDLNARF